MKMHCHNGENLIFLISQPRAGSTLTQRILAGHPEIYSHSETWLMLHPLHALKPRNFVSVFNSDICSIALNDFIQQLPGGINQYYSSMATCYHALYNAILQKAGKKLFLDKTPRYYLIVNELYQCFPGARFIFLWRNPAAVLTSIINTWAKNNLSALIEFKYDLLEAPSLMLEAIRRGMPNAISCYYEELLANPVDTIKTICCFIGVDFLPDMLKYQSTVTEKWRYGDKGTIYAKKEPDLAHLNQWKRELQNEKLARLVYEYAMMLGEDLFTEIGYSYREIIDLCIHAVPSDGTGTHSQLHEILLHPQDLEYENARLNAALKSQASLLKQQDQEIQKLKETLAR